MEPSKEGTLHYFKTVIEKAKESIPAIIFIDDIDFLCKPNSSPQVKELRESFIKDTKILPSTNSIYLVGATSEPWNLDLEIYKIFEQKIFVPLPDISERIEIFKTQLNPRNPSINEADLAEFAKLTDGLSGHRISILIKDALYEPLRLARCAKKFKKMPNGFLEPARDTDPEGFPCTINDIKDSSKINIPLVTKVFFLII